MDLFRQRPMVLRRRSVQLQLRVLRNPRDLDFPFFSVFVRNLFLLPDLKRNSSNSKWRLRVEERSLLRLRLLLRRRRKVRRRRAAKSKCWCVFIYICVRICLCDVLCRTSLYVSLLLLLLLYLLFCVCVCVSVCLSVCSIRPFVFRFMAFCFFVCHAGIFIVEALRG